MTRKTIFKALLVHEKTHARAIAKARRKKLTVDELINKGLSLIK